MIIACFCYPSFVSPNLGCRLRLILRPKRAGAIAWAVVIFVGGTVPAIRLFSLNGLEITGIQFSGISLPTDRRTILFLLLPRMVHLRRHWDRRRRLSVGQHSCAFECGCPIAGGGVMGININADLDDFQRSYIWIRVCKFLWTFVIIICAVRATLMIVELQRGFVTKPYMGCVALTYSPCSHGRKDKIIWECNHGGQIWSSNAEYAAKSSLPVGFCAAGFNSLYTAFIISLLVDLVFQVRSCTDHRQRKTSARF